MPNACLCIEYPKNANISQTKSVAGDPPPWRLEFAIADRPGSRGVAGSPRGVPGGEGGGPGAARAGVVGHRRQPQRPGVRRRDGRLESIMVLGDFWKAEDTPPLGPQGGRWSSSTARWEPCPSPPPFPFFPHAGSVGQRGGGR